jgi:hypothetical protein
VISRSYREMQLDTAPLDSGIVACFDEMGPQASKSYPRQRLVKSAGPQAERARREIDYRQRDVAGHVFGALQPATRATFTSKVGASTPGPRSSRPSRVPPHTGTSTSTRSSGAAVGAIAHRAVSAPALCQMSHSVAECITKHAVLDKSCTDP